MRLHEIINESDNRVLSKGMATTKIKIALSDLRNYILNLMSKKGGIQTDDFAALRHVYRWVQDNYFAKRGGTGHNIQFLMHDLGAPTPKYNMDKDSDDHKMSNLLKNVLDSLVDLGFEKEVKAVDDALDSLTQNAQGNRNVTDKASRSELRNYELERKKRTGQQQQQAEEIANQILANLPAGIASKVRAEIARSDNKLQALQVALKSYNIG